MKPLIPDKRKRRCWSGTLAVIYALSLATKTARGDEPIGFSASIPISLTVSGGVSLGAYEAGFLYYAVETLKANPARVHLVLATGASAGGTNALLSAVSSCEKPAASPQDNAFWTTWVPIGLDDLYVPADVTALGLFSRRGLHKALRPLQQRLDAGLAVGCDVVLGVSTTRLLPRSDDKSRSPLDLPRVEERFAFRVSGRGAGRHVALRNYADPTYAFSQPVLPTNGAGEVAFESVRDLLMASASFPLAFSPQPLAHCLTKPRDGAALPCTSATARSDLFLDGGVFDNQPTRLATRIAGAGLTAARDRTWHWNDAPKFDSLHLPDALVILHFSPDSTAYPVEPTPTVKTDGWAVTDLVGQFLGNFVSTARSKELFTLFEEQPAIRKNIRAAKRHLPTASALFQSFFGFFERDFRVFDFYLGMYDAWRMFEDGARSKNSEDEASLPVLQYPIMVPGSALVSAEDDWRPFKCLRAVLERENNAATLCEAAGSQNFRILLQTSLDQLHDLCVAAGKRGQHSDNHALCRDAMRGAPPVRIRGVAGRAGLAMGRDETDFSYTLRLLAEHRFAFHDLHLPPSEAHRAPQRLRTLAGRMIERFAAVQPGGASSLVRLLGPPLANMLAYASPETILYTVFGTPWELGWSKNFPNSAQLPLWFRVNAGLQVTGLLTFLSSNTNYLALTPVAGVELEIPPLTGSVLQTRVGLRAGYMFSTSDGFLFGTCRAANQTAPGAECSRFTAQALTAWTVYERLRVHLLMDWYPALRSRESSFYFFSPSVGAQISFLPPWW